MGSSNLLNYSKSFAKLNIQLKQKTGQLTKLLKFMTISNSALLNQTMGIWIIQIVVACVHCAKTPLL